MPAVGQAGDVAGRAAIAETGSRRPESNIGTALISRVTSAPPGPRRQGEVAKRRQGRSRVSRASAAWCRTPCATKRRADQLLRMEAGGAARARRRRVRLPSTSVSQIESETRRTSRRPSVARLAADFRGCGRTRPWRHLHEARQSRTCDVGRTKVGINARARPWPGR